MPCRTRRRWKLHALWTACLFGPIGALGTPAVSAEPAYVPARSAFCDQNPIRSIPARPVAAPTGSEFARRVQDLSGSARDAFVRAELLSGNLPDFLRHLVPVTLHAAGLAQTLTVCVLPDYLAVGTDRDFVFVPMGLEAALAVAAHYGFALPTPKVVDAVYAESPVKLHPLPLPAGAQMRSTAYFVYHNALIGDQRAALSAPLGELTSGHKKDLVLTIRLWQMPGRVAIYGWHRGVDAPIQPLSTVHGARYADYSHGVRLVSDRVYVNGTARNIADVLAEPSLARLLTNDGPMPQMGSHIALLMTRLEQPLTDAVRASSTQH